VSVLAQAGACEVVVVTGGDREQVEAALGGLATAGLPIRTAYNPRFEEDSMLLTLQAGIRALPESVQAALVALGDQPHILDGTVRQVIAAYRLGGAPLVVPSYNMRRGHPWLVDHCLWPDLLRRTPPETPRSFLGDHSARIEYVTVDSDTILRDLDTPEDYRRETGSQKIIPDTNKISGMMKADKGGGPAEGDDNQPAGRTKNGWDTEDNRRCGR
jgi:molybdenum cofactor cytidylyltransferase